MEINPSFTRPDVGLLKFTFNKPFKEAIEIIRFVCNFKITNLIRELFIESIIV